MSDMTFQSLVCSMTLQSINHDVFYMFIIFVMNVHIFVLYVHIVQINNKANWNQNILLWSEILTFLPISYMTAILIIKVLFFHYYNQYNCVTGQDTTSGWSARTWAHPAADAGCQQRPGQVRYNSKCHEYCLLYNINILDVFL